MSEMNTAPGGDGAAVTSVPVSDSAPTAIRDIANAIAARRNKEEAPAEAPQVAAEPEPDSAPADNAAPAEEATSEAPTETNEPAEELPPIEPPRSWTKEEKEEFRTYPREAQEKIARREQDRETALRRGQNETAEQRKETETLKAQLNEALRQYQEATNSALQAVRQATAGEFSDIRTPEDINKLATEDPLRFTRYQAHLMNVAQIEQANKQAQEQQRQQYQSQWSDWSSKEDAKFLERAPEMANKETAQKIADRSVDLLKSLGFSEQDLAKSWNGEASVSLRDHRIQQLILKAAKYDDAQTSAPKKVAKAPIPQVQRPGAARPQGADRDIQIKNLETKLEKSGSLKDAVALRLARASR